MLQQILRDMYVDPEILAELPEEQKEMLFFKIRQEQIRRYNEREKKNQTKNSHSKMVTKQGKKVRILEDASGNPWTWVYGEEEGVESVEEKWKRLHEKRMESAVKAVIEEEKFVREQTLKNGKNVSRQHGDTIIVKKTTSRSPSTSPHGSPHNSSPINQHKTSPQVSAEMLKRKEVWFVQNNTNQNGTPYAPPPALPVEQHDVAIVRAAAARQKHEKPKLTPKPEPKPRTTLNSNVQIVDKLKHGESSRKVSGLQRNGIAAKKRNISNCSNPIHDKHDDKKNIESVYESFYPEPRQDEVVSNEEWQTQLRRFKEADRQRSIRAHRASKEYRRQSMLASNPEKLRVRFKQLASNHDESETKKPPTLPPKPSFLRLKHPISQPGKQSKPKNREEVKEWFQNTQAHNISSASYSFPLWLHGLITRTTAEDLLKSSRSGDFLVRISDKIWGYALSYKDDDRVKHFLIDASEEQCYHFFGNDQIRHESLDELILYHQQETITYNGEKLKNSVGQTNPENPDYSDFECTISDTRL